MIMCRLVGVLFFVWWSGCLGWVGLVLSHRGYLIPVGYLSHFSTWDGSYHSMVYFSAMQCNAIMLCFCTALLLCERSAGIKSLGVGFPVSSVVLTQERHVPTSSLLLYNHKKKIDQ